MPSPTGSDPNSISIRGQIEDLILVILLLAGAVVTGWVIATVHLTGFILVILWILEIATIIAALNKTLPLLVTTVKHAHRVAVTTFDALDDLQSGVERRKIRIVLEDYSRVIEIPVTLRKEEIEEMRKIFQLLNNALEQAKVKQEISDDHDSK